MDSLAEWEKKLQDLGMPSEIPSEQEKAAKEGVELVSSEMADPSAEALAKKLQEEDPRNHLGGFPNSMEDLVSLVQTLRAEWKDKKISPTDMHLVIHSSCINGRDCVTLAYNGGDIYHYNTKNVRGYSRAKISQLLKAQGLYFVEK